MNEYTDILKPMSPTVLLITDPSNVNVENYESVSKESSPKTETVDALSLQEE